MADGGGLYAPKGVELVLERTGPIIRGKVVKVTIVQPLATKLS